MLAKLFILQSLARKQFGRVSVRTATLMSEIVWFSTKKSGEVCHLISCIYMHIVL